MPRYQGDHYIRVTKLTWAENELKRIADNITADVAPNSAKKIRSALRSVQGAIRNAEGQAERARRESGTRSALYVSPDSTSASDFPYTPEGDK